jgi:hypothetical protein
MQQKEFSPPSQASRSNISRVRYQYTNQCSNTGEPGTVITHKYIEEVVIFEGEFEGWDAG